jgi:hypothetical protein
MLSIRAANSLGFDSACGMSPVAPVRRLDLDGPTSGPQ